MGSLIDEGGFGCIFYPGFNCNGERNKDYTTLSKLVVDEFNAINEVYIGSLIQKIPNYRLFFLPVIEDCPIKISKLDQKLVTKCNVIAESELQQVEQKSEPKYLLLTIPYLKSISMRTLFRDSSRSKKHRFILFIDTFKYLINSITYLLDIGIIHYDLSIENIIYSTHYGVPLIIDFGLSFEINQINLSTIKEYFYTYRPKHMIWCLEIHAICYLTKKNDKLDEETITNMVDMYVDSNSGLNVCNEKFKNEYKEACKRFLRPFIILDKDDAINKLKAHYKTWDLYALSILYLRFLFYICNGKFIENKLLIHIAQILLTNISPDPNKRYSVDYTKQKWNELFDMDETPENYLLLRNFL